MCSASVQTLWTRLGCDSSIGDGGITVIIVFTLIQQFTIVDRIKISPAYTVYIFILNTLTYSFMILMNSRIPTSTQRTSQISPVILLVFSASAPHKSPHPPTTPSSKRNIHRMSDVVMMHGRCYRAEQSYCLCYQ